MNFLRSVFVLLFITLYSGISLPQESFEGSVDYKISDGTESTVLTYFVKEGKMKIDVKSEQNTSMVYNSVNKTMLVMMPEQKMYMEMPLDMGKSADVQKEKMDGDFTQTGETKDILGYKCEKWVYNDKENQIEAWLTQELGSFMFFSNPMEGDVPDWQKQLDKGGYFPMDVIVKQGTGETNTRMEVTAVEKKSLSEDMFTPPADYQKMDMPTGR